VRGARIGWHRAAAAAAVLLVAGACHGSSPKVAASKPTTTVSTSTVPATASGGSTTTSSIPIQDSGPRTVLSPVGLNVRAQPSKTAPIVGTAAQGTTLTVLSHTTDGGGFYQVRGATTTGYITDSPTLSDAGKFIPYSSGPLNFAALYPEGWTTHDQPPASVVFRPQTGQDSIVVTTATTLAQLPRGRTGYHQDSASVPVVCGVTGTMTVLEQSASVPPASLPGGTIAERYLVQLRLTLDAQHALGLDANLADLAQLASVKDVINSLSFPFPQCELGASPTPASSSTVP